MDKETKRMATNDVAHHVEVIPQRHRELFCNKQGAGRYTSNWVFGWPTKADRSVFVKTQADKDELKRMK